MKTEEILKQIYQDLKQRELNNDNLIFLKEYTIPSINYNENGNNREDLYFASGIEMELNRMIESIGYELYYASYKDKYFFSNEASLVKQKQLQEIEQEGQKEIKLKTEFIEKVEQEYSNLKEKLEKKSPKEIISKSYELVVKEQIKDELKYRNYGINELKALNKKYDVLEEFYQDWLSADGRLGEILENSIDDAIEIIVDNYAKEKRIKQQESR